MNRVLIVGLMPSDRLPTTYPPLAGSRSGDRLARMLNLTSSWDLQVVADLVNLLDLPQEVRTVKVSQLAEAAARLLPLDHEVTVALGSQVARALGHRLKPVSWSADRKVLCIPHPSGRSYVWNQQTIRNETQRALNQAFYDVRTG